MARILKLQHWKPEFDYNDAAFFARRATLPRTSSSSRGRRRPTAALRSHYRYGGYMSAFDDASHPWIAASCDSWKIA